MNNTVIACVDGSPSTRAVCEYAAWAAALLDSPLSLLHVLEKDAHPAVSDLTGSIGIDSQAHLTEELVKVEGERSRLLMAQGKAILAGCAELLNGVLRRNRRNFRYAISARLLAHPRDCLENGNSAPPPS